MGESIQQRTGKPLIAEDLWSFTKGEIGGDDQRGAFVALGEKAKEVFCGPLTQGDLAQLVDDNQIAFVDGSFQFLQVTLFSGFRIEGGQTSSGEKLDAISFATGRLSQTNGQVRLAYPRRSQKDNPFSLGMKWP